MSTANLKLEEQYRSTRAALLSAGLDMNGSIDALYRDWRRWRDKQKPGKLPDSVALGKVDQWWARHLAQFRSLIDSVHVSARAERARKDEKSREAGGDRD